MSNTNIEELIGNLYDLVQDARSMPLSADKCIIERDTVLDMLDEIIAQLPGELKQSRTIVESRNELINQARREAESVIRQAQEQAKQLVMNENIYLQAKEQSEKLIAQAQERVNQIRKAGNDYMFETLRRAEETVAEALADIQNTRMKFRSVTDAQEKRMEPVEETEE